MSENTIDLDFGTTAQKQQDGEKLPVVLLALDQGKYDMARSLKPPPCWGRARWPKRGLSAKI